MELPEKYKEYIKINKLFDLYTGTMITFYNDNV